MWASHFKPEKQPKSNDQPNLPSDSNGFINAIILICKGILVAANSFLNLNVLTVLIDFLDAFTGIKKPLDENQHTPKMF